MRYLNVNRKETITEEDYYQFALMELGGDTPSWYGLIDTTQGYVYSNIKVIIDGFTKPSESDVNAKITELKNAYSAAQYKRQRASEYPSWQKQLEKIYDDGIDAWKTEMVDPIKAKYPKPGE